MRINRHFVFVLLWAGFNLLTVVFSTPGYPRDNEWQRKGNFNTPQSPSRKKQSSSPTRQIMPASGLNRCRWVQSMVGGYAFENVKVRTCAGSAYIFEATREGKAFTIYMSIDTGELLKVEKFQPGAALQTDRPVPSQPH
jgi:hypothetical protein